MPNPNIMILLRVKVQKKTRKKGYIVENPSNSNKKQLTLKVLIK